MSAIRLQSIHDDELPDWIRRGSAAYAESRIRSGQSPESAHARSQKEWAELFPEGKRRDQHLIAHIIESDARVGWVWVGPANEGAGVDWWIWDVFVDEAHRGHGVAAAAIGLAEDHARGLGVESIGLNVFGYNATARELYERLDYSTFAVQMRKRLG